MAEKIVVDKQMIVDDMEDFDIVREFPVPEYAKEGEDDPVFIVRMASLDDQIIARELSTRPVASLMSVLKKVRDGDKVDNSDILDILKKPDIHEKTMMEINLFYRCVMNPKFTLEEVWELSRKKPKLVNRLASFVLGVED